ncbi:MAG: hypothetical protein R2792_16125 [Saprospiraceae bacterium]
MRFLNILPVLLILLTGGLNAQVGPCEISDLQVDPGNCTSDSTYSMWLNFSVVNSTNDSFEVWTANNQLLGVYSLGDLPLEVDNFPSDNTGSGFVRVCILDNNDCCALKQFIAPDCEVFGIPCIIADLNVEIGDCFPDGSYHLWINFVAIDPTNDLFDLWISGNYIGAYSIFQLPLQIPNFQGSGNDIETVKLCINDNPDCCATFTFEVPDCQPVTPTCTIRNLYADAGECTSDSTYNLWLNFQTMNSSVADSFQVFDAAGDLVGTFSVNQLPLQIQNYPWSGDNVDAVTVCFPDQANAPGCCRTIEFNAPECISGPCFFEGISIEIDGCQSDSTYHLWITGINFSGSANVDSFEVHSGTGDYLGMYAVADLPIEFANYPWNGDDIDYIKLCAADSSSHCCFVYAFNAPDCNDEPCGIFNLAVQTGDCNDDGTYGLTLNFALTNPSLVDSFQVWSASGILLGTYGFDQLPLEIDNFPWNGQFVDGVRICLIEVTGNLCCKFKQFIAPACASFPCDITGITVETGDCFNDGTYEVWINVDGNFSNTTLINLFAGNNMNLGTYSPSDFPVYIEHFPWSGGQADMVKVCIPSLGAVCCEFKEFDVPDCMFTGDCHINDLHVETGDCHNDGTYAVVVNFNAVFPTNTLFDVYANNQLIGTYPLSDLPLSIPNFPGSGNAVDVLKVCINDNNDCCAVIEFEAPDCSGTCDIYDVVVETGDCNPDGGYHVWIDFQVNNPGNDFFEVWGPGNTYIGLFPLNQLPLHIPNFPGNGGPNDVVKICINDHPDCCATVEFPAPNCGGDCEIYDFVLETGDCTGDSTYVVEFNFQVDNPGSASMYGVWANGQFYGSFDLADLPKTIQDFPWNGGAHDVIKICLMPDDPGEDPYCCKIYEFQVPPCLGGGDCDIYDVVVETGDCNPDGGYHVWIDFNVDNPGNDLFEVWGPGNTYLGAFPLSQLPLHIPNFPGDGGPNDVVTICINDQPNCCATVEFPAPNCGSDCEIYDFVLETGDCTGDSTYVVEFNFQVDNPGSATMYGVWANGQYYGSFDLADLPKTIQDFPWNGGANDVIKVCLMPDDPNEDPYCCKVYEFPVPPCLGGGDCNIYDVVVETGDCNPDGGYHVWINFHVDNPGNDLFEVWGPGNTYIGVFPLSQLPLHIPNFPGNGGPNDVVTICINDQPNCCATVEFPAPNCGGDCEIYDFVLETGDCTGDSTYVVQFNFEVDNPGNATMYGVWANGQFYGSFPQICQRPSRISLGMAGQMM